MSKITSYKIYTISISVLLSIAKIVNNNSTNFGIAKIVVKNYINFSIA